jgi:NAD(P)-dependent dehydrogenase (short-subunit alcohol dehydrogenase family)
VHTDFVDHKGKIVVITGASGQIGRELCRQYLLHNALVIGLDINKEFIADFKTDKFYFENLDITDLSGVEKCLQKLKVKFGSIDILINNAGLSTFKHYLDRSEYDIDLIMDVNLKGTFNCIRAFVLSSSESITDRSIVNIGSIYGIVSPDFRIYESGDRRSPEIYGATKAGVIQLSKYFAVALSSEKIRVNSVSPGGVFNPEEPQGVNFIKNYSDRTPLGRMAEVSEIVNAVLFLTSSSASYITGHNLVVDGGYSAL